MAIGFVISSRLSFKRYWHWHNKLSTKYNGQASSWAASASNEVSAKGTDCKEQNEHARTICVGINHKELSVSYETFRPVKFHAAIKFWKWVLYKELSQIVSSNYSVLPNEPISLYGWFLQNKHQNKPKSERLELLKNSYKNLQTMMIVCLYWYK